MKRSDKERIDFLRRYIAKMRYDPNPPAMERGRIWGSLGYISKTNLGFRAIIDDAMSAEVKRKGGV